jgi:D-alanine-D-alanine ligase
MVKINQHIEIVSSTCKGLSSMSQISRDGARAVLSRHYREVGITIVNDLSDLEALVASQPDLVFLGMDFVPADSNLGIHEAAKVWLADYLELRGIAHTGSKSISYELEHDKPTAKRCILAADLATSPFYVAKCDEPLTRDNIDLSFPLFVKPTNKGGGMGIDSDSVAHDFEQLQLKVQSIAENLRSDSLIEEYLPGREFSVAILKDENSADYEIMPIELIAQPNDHGVRMLSKQVKSDNTECAIEVTDKIIKECVTKLAINVFYALGARDYGRIDIRMDKYGIPQFLEANLIPSLMNSYGSFPKACLLNIGMDYEDMLLSIVRLGLSHNQDEIEEATEFNTLVALA